MQFRNPKQQSFIDHERTDVPLSDHEMYEREFWSNHGTDERLMITKREPEIPEISFEDQYAFWNCLSDVQFGKFDPEAMTKANTWVVTRHGTWLVQKNTCGYFGAKKSDIGIPTLPDSNKLPNAFFDLTYGKIPNDILQQVVAFFREIMKRHNNAEAFVQIYWDLQDEKYVVHIPKQRVSGAAVRYDAEENLNVVDKKRYIFVYECHSHNSMPAFWSGTDDADEKELRVYGVFGHLDHDEYACLHRFFVGEKQVNIDNIGLVFDIPPKQSITKYVVTHKDKQYVVDKDLLILDQKPKYIYQTEDGSKVYVPVEDVSPFKELEVKTKAPEDWFSNVNVPLPDRDYTSQRRLPGTTVWGREESYGRNWDGGSGFIPDYPSQRKDAISYDEEAQRYVQTGMEKSEEEATEEYEMMVDEVGSMTCQLLQSTYDFEELESTFVFLETVEQNQALKALEKAIENYYYRSRKIEEGPSDGRY